MIAVEKWMEWEHINVIGRRIWSLLVEINKYYC